MRPFFLSSIDLVTLRDQFKTVCDVMEQPMSDWDAIECGYDREGKQQVRAFASGTASGSPCAIEVRFTKVKPADGTRLIAKWQWRAEAEISDEKNEVRNILRLDSEHDEVVEYMRVIPKDG